VQSPGVVESTPATVITSPQLSVAESEIIAGTSPPQISVTSAGAEGATGGTVSSTLMVCDIDVEFAQASVNVHVRVTVNVFAQSPGVTVSTPSTVMAPRQLSVAVREIIAGTSAAHVTLAVAGASGATGAVTSLIVNVPDVVAVFPQASVAVKVTVTAAEQSFAIPL
jgi:hypothetical protein